MSEVSSTNEMVTGSPTKQVSADENAVTTTVPENGTSKPTTNGSPEKEPSSSSPAKTEKTPVKSSPAKTGTTPVKSNSDKTGTTPVKSSPAKTGTTPVKSSSDKTGTTPVKSSPAKLPTPQKSEPAPAPAEVESTTSDSPPEVTSNVTNEESVTAETETNIEEVLAKADQACSQGKRSLAIQDYPAAVASFAEACELYISQYGEMADELADIYFFYGKALFANARSQSDVLGDQIEKDKDEPTDDEEEGEEEDNEAKSSEAEVKPDESEKPTEDENKTDKAEAEGTDCEIRKKSADEGVAGGSKDDGNTNEEENVDEEGDDMQLSWEILELAKVIYERLAAKDHSYAIKLSEVYFTLGENGLESERFETAIGDIKTSLELQHKHMKADDRRIAQSLYQLGMAYALLEDFDGAVENFKLCIAQLETRLASLAAAKTAGLQCPDGEEHDSFYDIDKEIEDINAIIKDINEKINDTEDSKKVKKAELIEKLGFDKPENAAATSSASTASDINHLVKKRKNEGSSESNQEKKPKTE